MSRIQHTVRIVMRVNSKQNTKDGKFPCCTLSLSIHLNFCILLLNLHESGFRSYIRVLVGLTIIRKTGKN